MDARQRQDLDNYITGHYGEDQFERSEFWPVPTVHQEHAERHLLHDVYEYDPTDDGPEVELITRILAADWYYEINKEYSETTERRCGVIKSRYHV